MIYIYFEQKKIDFGANLVGKKMDLKGVGWEFTKNEYFS